MSNDPRARLSALRAELGQINQAILALVAKRQAAALRIGAIKRELGMPMRDVRQECVVIENARAAAAAHGLSPAMSEEVMRVLIRCALTVQENEP